MPALSFGYLSVILRLSFGKYSGMAAVRSMETAEKQQYNSNKDRKRKKIIKTMKGYRG